MHGGTASSVVIKGEILARNLGLKEPSCEIFTNRNHHTTIEGSAKEIILSRGLVAEDWSVVDAIPSVAEARALGIISDDGIRPWRQRRTRCEW